MRRNHLAQKYVIIFQGKAYSLRLKCKADSAKICTVSRMSKVPDWANPRPWNATVNEKYTCNTSRGSVLPLTKRQNLEK